jgi:hypothetical protein
MAWLKFVGTGMSAGGQWIGGNAAEDLGENMQGQYNARASTRRAVAQREAADERRMGDLRIGRAKAVMTANGGTTDDAQALMQLSVLDEDAEYRAMARMFTGEDEAMGLEEMGIAAAMEGEAKKAASRWGAGATILSSAASWYDPKNTGVSKGTAWKKDPNAKKGSKANPRYYGGRSIGNPSYDTGASRRRS